LGGAGAWFIARFAFRFGLIDIPNERSSHEIPIPIPKGGGVGILVAFVLSSYALKVPTNFWLPASLLALVSLYGDRFEISPKIRLTVQFAAALFLLLTSCPPYFNPQSFLYPILLSVFVVGTANFYNFMDGINGIAGITGMIGFGLLAFYASFYEFNASLAALAICMSFACLGFLPFNMPKARVFMGDVGSILLGFVFAGIVVLISKTFLDIITYAAFLFPFYADELTTMMIRIREGERLSQPHRRHLYQLLANEYQISHWKVSFGYGFFQLIIGISVIIIKKIGIMAVVSALVFYFCAFTLLSGVLRNKLESQI